MMTMNSIFSRRACSCFGACLIAAVLVLAASPTQVSAGTINLVGENQTGAAGWGNQLYILGIQEPNDSQPGSPSGSHDGKEWGSVSWNGTQDVKLGEIATGGGSPSTQTRTVADLLLAGVTADNLAIIFNINQANHASLDMPEFHVIGYAPDGTVIFDAKYTGDNSTANILTFAVVHNGQGVTDYGFDVNEDLTSFFANPLNRIGVTVPQGNQINNVANDGAESFLVASHERPAAVPVPPSIVMAGIGVASLFGFRFYRRKKVVAA